MLADAATAERAAFDRPFDVCVVGAGPAGITLARRLAARGLDVALMEAGELDYCDESQAFYAGEIVGLPQAPCEESRLRCFGGTSGHWEGKCRAFEAEDLAPRPWMPLSGWPIGLAELAPSRAEAAAILDLEAGENPPDGPLAEPSDRFRHVVWRMSPPTRFGDKYRDEVIAAPRITLGVRATLVDLRLSDDSRTVTTGVFRACGAASSRRFTVTARAFALCMGGLENARALLNCRGQVAAGIGNGNDLVGRYFCDRPAVATGNLLLAGAIGHEERYFTPTPALAAERGPRPLRAGDRAARRASGLQLPQPRLDDGGLHRPADRADARRDPRPAGRRPATTAASRRWRSASRPTATPSPSSASRSSNG